MKKLLTERNAREILPYMNGGDLPLTILQDRLSFDQIRRVIAIDIGQDPGPRFRRYCPKGLR